MGRGGSYFRAAALSLVLGALSAAAPACKLSARSTNSTLTVLSVSASSSSVSSGASVTITASGGLPPYEFSLVSGGGTLVALGTSSSDASYTAAASSGLAQVTVFDLAGSSASATITLAAAATTSTAASSTTSTGSGSTTTLTLSSVSPTGPSPATVITLVGTLPASSASVSLYSNSGCSTALTGTSSASAGLFTASGALVTITADAVNPIYGKAVTAAGDGSGSCVSLVSYTSDTTAPTDVTSVTSPTGALGSLASFNIVFTGTATDGLSGVQKLQYKVVRNPSTVVRDWTDASGSTTPLSVASLSMLEGSAHHVELRVVDNAGNASAGVSSPSFTPDVTPPAIAITSPAANGATVNPGSSVSGTCETGIGVQVTYDPDGAAAAGNTVTTVACASNSFSTALLLTDLDGSRSVTINSTDGLNAATPVVRTMNYVDPKNWTALAGGAPGRRTGATSVWTGSKLLVWGGIDHANIYINTGGKYDPVANTWTPITDVGAPVGRAEHGAAWLGGQSKMLVFGGTDGGAYFNTGGLYDPTGDAWTLTPINGPAVPSMRSDCNVVSDGGSLAIIWGGWDGTNYLNTGSRYDGSSNTWVAAIPIPSSPAIRRGAMAAYSSVTQQYLVWGGLGTGATPLTTGARFNAVSYSWQTIGTGGAPSARTNAYSHFDAATNQWMIWGGFTTGTTGLNSGGIYNAVVNSWLPVPATNAPSQRGAMMAAWTGSRLFVFGGVSGASYRGDGGVYDTAGSTWTPLQNFGQLGPAAYGVGFYNSSNSRFIIWSGRSSGLAASATNAGWYSQP